MNGKLVRELALIAALSLFFPTVAALSLSPLWWGVEPIKVFAGYLLGIVGTAVLLGAVSVTDELKSSKERSRRHGK